MSKWNPDDITQAELTALKAESEKLRTLNAELVGALDRACVKSGCIIDRIHDCDCCEIKQAQAKAKEVK